MKKIIMLSAVLTALCLKGYSAEPGAPFTKVDLSSVGKVYITQGDSDYVVVNTSGSKEDISTSIKNGTLLITSNVNADYHVTMRQIEALKVSGSGEIITASKITSDKLDLDVSGNGKITAQLNVKSLEVNIGGVGKVILSGNADHADIAISGSGKVEAFDLHVNDCRANISGVGKCNIDVTESLTTDISGMGSVHYKTKPKNLHEEVSGLGKVSDSEGDGGKNDTTHIKFGDSNILIIENDSVKAKKKTKRHGPKPIWQGFEMGFNSYLNSSGNSDLPPGYSFLDLNPGKSISVSLNLLQQNFRFGNSNFWFFTGLGVTWNNYRFDDNVYLVPGQDFIAGYADTSSGISYVKSKLTTTYLMAPLMFEVFTSRNKKDAFHIGAGGLVGYRIETHSKMKYESDGATYKSHVYNDFYLNPFRYGARVAVGYRKFNVFGDYYFSGLFRDGKGPTLYPINFGITLIPF